MSKVVNQEKEVTSEGIGE